VIHHRLEGARRICQSEEHDQGFKQAVFCFEHPFLFVTCFNPNVIVTPAHVEFGEDVGILYLTDQVWYEWQRIAVADGMLVQFLIILYQAQFSIFLLNKEEQ